MEGDTAGESALRLTGTARDESSKSESSSIVEELDGVGKGKSGEVEGKEETEDKEDKADEEEADTTEAASEEEEEEARVGTMATKTESAE